MNLAVNKNTLGKETKAGRLLEQLLKLPPRPKLYAAGKISKNDWRRVIVAELPEVDTCEPEIWDPKLLIDCQTFRYCGPFFVRCDHGCSHRPAGHAAAGCSDDFFLEDDGLHPKVWSINRARLCGADIVLAYIDETDCFGTLIEIGQAAEMGQADRSRVRPTNHRRASRGYVDGHHAGIKSLSGRPQSGLVRLR